MSYKYISLYCPKKRDECGNGTLKVRIDFTDIDEFKEKKREMREKQMLMNVEYRKNNATPFRKERNNPNNKLEKRQHVLDPLKPRVSSQNYGVNKIQEVETIQGLPELELKDNLANYKTGNGVSTLILGSSGVGKTHVMKAIYEEYFSKQKFESVLFSINSHADVYKSMPKKVTMCNKFCEDSNILLNQMKKVNMVQNNEMPYLIMLDDIIDAKYSGTLNSLLLTWRNSSFYSIINLQYAYLLAKGARASIRQILFGAFHSEEAIESVIKSFLGSTFSSMGVHNMGAQINLYKKLTADYHFLYFNAKDKKLVRFKLLL